MPIHELVAVQRDLEGVVMFQYQQPIHDHQDNDVVKEDERWEQFIPFPSRFP